MSLILNIDTSTEVAIISLTFEGKILSYLSNYVQKEHGVFVHQAVLSVLRDNNCDLKKVSAVAVTCGPGSYTGIRVGMSAAKGLCYSLNIPLIMINSLTVLAQATKFQFVDDVFSFVPVIDARRLEVYTAIFNSVLDEIEPAKAEILSSESYKANLDQGLLVFAGSGTKKIEEMIKHQNLFIAKSVDTVEAMNKLSFNYFNEKKFSDIITSKPLYLKDIYKH